MQEQSNDHLAEAFQKNHKQLETIDVNYAPNGAQFYEVPGENIASRGRTGMPVGVQLTLNFTETSILTKNDLRDPASGGNK